MTWLFHFLVFRVWKYFNQNKFIYVTSEGKTAKVLHANKDEGAVRFVCLSDTHMKHRFIDVPPGDVLLLCGDLLIMDKGAERGGIQNLEDINRWLGTLPHRHKLVIAGNHDRTIEQLGKDGVRAIFTNATYLQDEEITVFGIRIYATPISIQGISMNRAFQQQRESDQMQQYVNQIPEGIDILMTHGPPLGYGDSNSGCRLLRSLSLSLTHSSHTCALCDINLSFLSLYSLFFSLSLSFFSFSFFLFIIRKESLKFDVCENFDF
jgi:predicted phosphohydrolase